MKKYGSKEIESIDSDQPSAEESKSLDGTPDRPLSENFPSITKQGRVNQFSSRQQDLLGFGVAWKAILQQQKIMGIGDVAKAILQQQDALGFSSAAKAILQQQKNLDIGDVAKTILQQRDTLGIGAATRAIFEQQKLLGIGDVARTILEQRDALGISAATNAIFQQHKLMAIGDVAKTILKQQDVLGVHSFKKLIEQQRGILGLTSFSKAIDSISLEMDSALKNVSLEGLLDELKGRNLKPPTATKTTQVVQASEPRAAEKEFTPNDVIQPSNSERKNSLSSISTITLVLLLHIIMFLALQIETWEATRQSIVDINSRLPQTQSFSTIRKFIRTELAGKPGDIRLTKDDKVQLRQDPSTKSETILKLPKNSVVVVLEKTDRSWLFVSYEHQGYWIEGYISNKQLVKVRK